MLSRWAYLALTLLFQTVVSGVIFGFPALQNTLIDTGVFSDECESGDKGCDKQTVKLGLCFTIAAAMLTASGVVLGPVMDKFGQRVVRIGSAAAFVGGFLMAGLSPNNSVLWFPAFSLIAFGGGGIQLTSFSVSSLFPSHSSAVVSLIAGTFSASSSIFLFAKMAHDNLGMQLRPAFLAYTAVGGLCFVTAFLWPDKPFSTSSEKGSDVESESLLSPTENTINYLPSRRKALCIDFSAAPLRVQLKQVECWVFLVWYAVALLMTTFFLSSVSGQLAEIDKTNGDKISSAFGIIYPLGFIGTPLVGVIQDRFPLPFVFAFVNFVILSYQVVLLIPSGSAQYLTFILFCISRQYIFAIFFAAIGSMFGYGTFGFITGVANLLSVGTTLLNYPILAFCTAHGYRMTNIIIAVVTAANIPLSLWMWRRLSTFRQS